MSRDDTHRDNVDAAASRWLAERRMMPVDAESEAEFNEWRLARRQNEATYREMACVLNDVAGMRHLGDVAPPPDALPSNRRRWRAAAALMGSVTLVLALVIGISRPADPDTRYATGVGQLRIVELADGTRVTLGARSRIETRFDKDARRVRVLTGEAMFDIASRKGAPPFVVDAANIAIRDIGTRFNVHLSASEVQVAVVSGMVEMAAVRPALLPQPVPIRLAAGEAGRITTRSSSHLSPSFYEAPAAPVVKRTTAPAAWPTGTLVYDGVPLAEIAADLDRYVPGGVRIDGAGVGSLKLATSFRSDQIPTFLKTLPAALPVRVYRSKGDGYVIGPRP